MADRAAEHNGMGGRRITTVVGSGPARTARFGRAWEDAGMGSKRIEMELYSEPPGASVISARTSPVITGDGSIDYVCAACGAVVCGSMRAGEVDGVAFRCPECRRVNRVKG